MIEIDIPSIDPMQHEPKIFFGLTSRQCICIVPGVGIGFGLFMLTYDISLDLAVILLAVGIIPAICFGWLKPYNMKFEEYLKLLWFNTFISDPKRIYKTDNAEPVKLMTIKERKEMEKKQKEEELNKKKKRNADKKKSAKGKGIS